MQTDIFRAFGTDGRMHIVFRRTQTFFVKTAYGPVQKRREPKFYLDNGEPLECADRYDTFRTLAGDLVVRIVDRNAPKRGHRGPRAPA